MHESIWFLGTDPCCSDLKTSVNPVLIKHVYTLTKWCHIHDTVNNTVLKMWAAKQWHFFGPPCSKTARLAQNLWCHNKIRLGTHFDCVYHACVIFFTKLSYACITKCTQYCNFLNCEVLFSEKNHETFSSINILVQKNNLCWHTSILINFIRN